GLVIGGVAGLKLRGEGGLLVVRDRGVEVLPAGAELPAGADVTELPLTADGGKLRPEAREIGAMRARAAACALEDGTFVVASTTFDSDEATTEALLDLGCARVVALDRGTHRNAFIHRAGVQVPPPPSTPSPDGEPTGEPTGEPSPAAPTAPQATYEDTTLFLLEVPMPGRVRKL
ncbi:MAG: hypothetical protein IT372_12130, partial [Polyangiaceae bacterium]|nr:hypothetical protein [Polyangiaceae bacterium]